MVIYIYCAIRKFGIIEYHAMGYSIVTRKEIIILWKTKITKTQQIQRV